MIFILGKCQFHHNTGIWSWKPPGI